MTGERRIVIASRAAEEVKEVRECGSERSEDIKNSHCEPSLARRGNPRLSYFRLLRHFVPRNDETDEINVLLWTDQTDQTDVKGVG